MSSTPYADHLVDLSAFDDEATPPNGYDEALALEKLRTASTAPVSFEQRYKNMRARALQLEYAEIEKYAEIATPPPHLTIAEEADDYEPLNGYQRALDAMRMEQ
jgi:hypothetical protein